ncbi:hypothetical protein HQ590_15945 [bacterium]|nr:hypothetical protein [bacterium]
MKPHPQQKGLTFGELIAAVYQTCGRRRAGGILRLAIKAHVVVFRGHQRLVTD